jgi:hypothetical protein
MKVLFWILLVVNLVLFAVMRGDLLGDGTAVVAQPALNADKIRLLSEPVQALNKPAQAAPASSPSPAAILASTEVQEKPAPLCMEWSDFSGADLKRANEALAGLPLNGKLSQRPIEYNIGYWVYIPPLKNKASINQKIAQLKARGVEEYFVVQEAGEWQHAISLGVFKSEEAAQKFLESLIAKDVHSAKIGERASKLKATVFVFNGLDAQTAEKLSALQKDFPASELKKMACH